MLKDPFGLGYICRFCFCKTFEDIDTVIRHLWDNHSLDVGNLVFHDCCVHCDLRNSIFNVQAAVDETFGAGQDVSGNKDGGGQN
jgi:hypothetical protein